MVLRPDPWLVQHLAAEFGRNLVEGQHRVPIGRAEGDVRLPAAGIGRRTRARTRGSHRPGRSRRHRRSPSPSRNPSGASTASYQAIGGGEVVGLQADVVDHRPTLPPHSDRPCGRHRQTRPADPSGRHWPGKRHCRRTNPSANRLRAMDYRTLGNSGCAVSTLALGTMTFGAEADEAASHAQLDRFVEAGGTLIDTADVYSAGAFRGDHRPLAGRPTRGCDRTGRAGHEGALPDGGRPERCRPLRPAPDQGPRRLAAPARRRRDRPVPGPRVRSAHPAGGDAADLRRLHPGRQDPLLRPVELHRLAAHQGRPPRPEPEPGATDHPAAAVQPAGPGDRMGDRAGRAGRRPRAAARGHRWAAAGSPASTGATSGPPAPPGSARTRPRHGGLSTSATSRTAPGTSSTPCRRSPTRAASRWRRSRWPG